MGDAKILIVEDEGIVALDLSILLKSLGYAVPAVASSGAGAIRKVAETRPDLVMMDIRLRGDMDGIEAAETIYARFGLPVIYMTALADEGTVRRCEMTKHYGYIGKPFEAEDLEAVVEEALRQHQVDRGSGT
jgi:CheY-like chemotaxis protein